MRIVLFILSLATVWSPSAHGIVVSDYAVAQSPPAGEWDLDWAPIYRYRFSSAVAVAPHWLLTAAHVAYSGHPTTIVVNGTNYYQQEMVFHLPDDDPQHAARADLALIRFDQAFPAHYPLYTGSFPSAPPQKLKSVLVGYGRTGAVFNVYYTMSGAGDGIKRWGTQRIDNTTILNYPVVDYLQTPNMTNDTFNQGFRMDFDLADTDYEAGAAVHDSGGGVFVKEGAEWKLAGIMANVYSTAGGYNGIFALSVPDYHDWIQSVIDPSADLDGDGIPNYWEAQYSGSVTGLVAAADNDADGYTNEEEYIADTDPTDDTSFPRLDGATQPPAPILSFWGSTGRVYQIEYTTNDLAFPAVVWDNAHTNLVWGTGQETWITVTNSAHTIFYRLTVRLP